MTKPANFPERKRQRRMRALSRLAPRTAGKDGKPSASNDDVRMTLHARIGMSSKRDVMTKKDRSASAKLTRTAAQ